MVSLSYAMYKENAKRATGTKYLMYPSTPPNAGLSVCPKYPDFVYISTASKILSTISIATVMFSFFCSCFFLLFLPLGINFSSVYFNYSILLYHYCF